MRKILYTAIVLLTAAIINETTLSQEIKVYTETKGGTITLKLKSDKKIDYMVIKDGESQSLIVKNYRVPTPASTRIDNEIIKNIIIETKGKDTYIKATIKEGYIIECTDKENTVTCKPKKADPKDVTVLRLNTALYHENCLEFKETYSHNRDMLYKSVNKKTLLILYEEFLATCALKERDYTTFMEATSFLQNLQGKIPLDIRLRKLELLYRLNRLYDVITEGGVIISEHKGEEIEYKVAPLVIEALATRGRLTEAINMARKYEITKIPEKYKALFMKALGKTYYNSEIHFAAYLYYKNAFKLDPTLVKIDPLGLYQMGMSAYKTNKKEEAKELLLLAHNIHPEIRNEAGEALYIVGSIEKDKGKLEKAKWLFNMTATLYPETKGGVLAKLNLALLELKENPKRALMDLENIATSYSQFPDVKEIALFHIAKTYKEMGDLEKAIKTYEEFMKSFPKSSLIDEVRKNLKDITYQKIQEAYNGKRWEEVIVEGSKFLKEYKNDPFSHQVMNLIKLSLKQLIEESIKTNDCNMVTRIWNTYKNFIEIKEDDEITTYRIAECLYATNRDEAAHMLINILDKKFKLFPKKHELIDLLLEYFLDRKDKESIERLVYNYSNYIKYEKLKKVIRLLNNQYTKEGNLSGLYKLKGIEGLPNDVKADIDFNLSITLIDKGNLAEVEKIINEKNMLRNTPDKDELIRMLLARELILRNNTKKATEILEKFVNIYTRSKYVPEALFMLGYISKSKKSQNIWWEMLEKKYKTSYWYKELYARKFAEESIEWAKRIVSKQF